MLFGTFCAFGTLARMRHSLAALAGIILLGSTPASAFAFCGFYVASAEGDLQNASTHVILMRAGTQTVLSMQNDYRGPVEDFAMIVPVPAVLSEDDVRTLPSELFQRVLDLTGPRLVEYWEADPCRVEATGEGTIGLGNLGTIGHGAGGSGYGRGAEFNVRVEAQFAVGEYDIEILSAEESDGLEGWLRANEYRVPDGAAAMLRPYVESGMKFFVAKVDASRARFEGGRAVLSPLRVNYASETFQLPVRLGMLNSGGSQDLIVNVIGQNQRYEVANYPNAFIPTNLDLSNEARDHFGALYDALFTETLEQNPGAVITEYSWQAGSCDPCPTEALTPVELATLGGDVAGGEAMERQLRLAVPTTDGPVHADIVRRVMRRHFNEVRFCTQNAPLPEEPLEFSFSVQPDGSTSDVAVTTQGGPAECIRGRMARWMFPSEATATRVSGSFPVVLVPASRWGGDPRVITRLHYRYEPGGLGEDLVFRAATPMEGGREFGTDGDELSAGAASSRINNFQARYAIRHEWEGPIECDEPRRGMWSGQPPEGPAPATVGAGRTEPGEEIQLSSFIVNARGFEVSAAPQNGAAEPAEAEAANDAPEASQTLLPAVNDSDDDGCSVGAAGSHSIWMLALAMFWIARRRV